jgi:Flp pilus assembly protein CpaB
LVGVLLAVLAFVLVVVLLNGQQGTAAEQRPTTTKVLVAKQNIDIGVSVTPEMVEVKEVSPTAVAGTPLHDSSQISGRPALVNVPAGSQVNLETFGAGVGDIASKLKPGEKAIAFIADPVTGVNFLIQPGDVIDVVLAEQIPADLNPPGDSLRTVKAVLQNKRVLYVSATNIRPATAPAASASPTPAPQAAQQPQAALQSAIIVFAGTDQDAEIIKFAQLNQSELTGGSGSLTAVIRSAEDTATEETTGVTIDLLIKNHGLIVPDVSGIDTGASPSASPAQ